MANPLVREHAIAEVILRDLDIRWRACPELPLLWRHVVYGFHTALVPYTEDEIRAAVADLVERGLAAAVDAPGGGELPEKGYVITARGRDFLSAHFPWDRLSEF
jgi:hypothetical protein